MRCIKKKIRAFGVVEIVIVLLITSLLATALLPSFQFYIKKTKFKDVITAVDNSKSSVNACILLKGSTNSCSGGTDQVISNQTFPSGANVSSVSVASGVITGTGSTDLDSATYILTPTIASNNVVTWALSGTCLTTYGYCDGGGTTSSTDSGSGGGSGPTYTSLQQQTVSNCSTPSTTGFYCSSGSVNYPCACGGGGAGPGPGPGPGGSLATTLAQCQTTANNLGNDPATCVLMP